LRCFSSFGTGNGKEHFAHHTAATRSKNTSFNSSKPAFRRRIVSNDQPRNAVVIIAPDRLEFGGRLRFALRLHARRLRLACACKSFVYGCDDRHHVTPPYFNFTASGALSPSQID
jgi:hypothetical protein